MSWVVYVAGAVLSWGVYGAVLHKGQVLLGSPLRAFLCVGIAYFLIAVLVPVATLAAQGELRNFTLSGTLVATAAGALGAIGAVCIIFSFRAGASPLYVMPLVFGGAPLVNVLTTMVCSATQDDSQSNVVRGLSRRRDRCRDGALFPT